MTILGSIPLWPLPAFATAIIWIVALNRPTPVARDEWDFAPEMHRTEISFFAAMLTAIVWIIFFIVA